MVDLSVKLAGINLKNPVLTAPGPPVRSGKSIVDCERGGAGGIVAKTVSVKAAPVPRPNMAILDRGRIMSIQYTAIGDRRHIVVRTGLRVGKGFINTELWTELSFEQWLKEEYPIAKSVNVPLIASVGYTPDDMDFLIPRLKEIGFDAIEFSTHYIEPGIIMNIIKTIKKHYDIPVFAKLSPHHPEQIVQQAKEAEAAGADAIVAINSFGPTLHFDIDNVNPYMGSKFGYGWLSGPPIKPLAVRCVFDIARTVSIPVIGVGGITSGRDAVEHIMAGASAVGICTAAIIEGPSIFGRVASEIEEFMESHGYSSIDEIRGLFLERMREGQAVKIQGGHSSVDEELCKGCSICQTSCRYEAIQMVDRGRKKVAYIDESKCQACGLCTTVCPVNAMELVFGESGK